MIDRRASYWILGALAIALSGCATRAGALTRGEASLGHALSLWSSFPSDVTPRPIVLIGSSVSDPPRGFRNAAIQARYYSRRFRLRVSLPSPTASERRRALISAQAAYRTLLTPTGVIVPARGRLSVTSVSLGSGVFITDRGPKRLAAWRFAIAGVSGTVGVAAITPPRLFVPAPGVPAARDGGDTAVLLNGGKQVRVQFFGAPAGTRPCDSTATATALENTRAVAIRIREMIRAGTCDLVAYPRSATVQLKHPLGRRVLVTAGGAPIEVKP